MYLFIVPILISLSAVIFSVFLNNKYSSQKIDDIETKAILQKLSKAVWAYFIKTHQLTAVAVGVLAILIFIIPAFGWTAVLGLIFGVLMSLITAYFSCIFIIRLNSKIVSHSSYGFVDLFNLMFGGGGLVAMLIFGMAILTVSSYYFIFSPPSSDLLSLALGVVVFAFFSKVTGRIYKETANNKMDLHEQHKESRNPRVIIRLTGNAIIGPMGLIIDLFATLIIVMVGSMLVSSLFLPGFGGGIALPLLIMVSGMISSFAGAQLIKIGVTTNIFKNIIFAVLGVIVLSVVLISPSVFWSMSGNAQISSVFVLISSVLGLLAGGGILFLNYVLNSKRHSSSLVAGIFGVAIFAAILVNTWLGGWYGISIFMVSMASLAGTALALHMFSSISIASKEIARLAGLPEERRKLLEKIDVVNDTVYLSLSRYILLSAILGLFVLAMLYNREVMAFGVAQIDFSLEKETVLAGIFLGLSGFYFLVYFIDKFLKRAGVEELKHNLDEEISSDIQDAKSYSRLSGSIASYSAKKTLIFLILVLSMPILTGLILRAEVLGGFLMGIIIFGGFWSVSKLFNKSIFVNKKKETFDYNNSGYFVNEATSFYSPAIELMAIVSLLLIVFLI